MLVVKLDEDKWGKINGEMPGAWNPLSSASVNHLWPDLYRSRFPRKDTCTHAPQLDNYGILRTCPHVAQ